MNAETVAQAVAEALTTAILPFSNRPLLQLTEHVSPDEETVEETDDAPGHYGFQVGTPDGKSFWINVEELP